MDSNHIYLGIVNFNSALKKYENNYPQVFLKEFKYIKKKVIRHIIDDLGKSCDDFDDSDEE